MGGEERGEPGAAGGIDASEEPLDGGSEEAGARATGEAVDGAVEPAAQDGLRDGLRGGEGGDAFDVGGVVEEKVPAGEVGEGGTSGIAPIGRFAGIAVDVRNPVDGRCDAAAAQEVEREEERVAVHALRPCGR